MAGNFTRSGRRNVRALVSCGSLAALLDIGLLRSQLHDIFGWARRLENGGSVSHCRAHTPLADKTSVPLPHVVA